MQTLTHHGVAEAAGRLACHDCDLLFSKPQLGNGEKARCPRCGAVLFERKAYSLDHSLALALTSLILFALANIDTLMRMNIGGRVQSGAIITGSASFMRKAFGP